MWGLTAAPQTGRQFVDVTQAAGIDFLHVRAPSEKKYLVEIMGGGCAFLDYDRDNLLDVFLVNGGRVPEFRHEGSINHGLFRNLGNGRFKNVTDRAGIREKPYYGMGVAVGDYDNNGFEDLYITYFGGPNQLYHNNGDGTFVDVARHAGVGGNGLWSTSAAFFDFNNDGYLDIYVCRYVDFSFANNRVCGPVEDKGLRAYCSPKIYGGIPDFLFRNNRDGTFTDVSSQSGIGAPAGKGLGVVAADLNGDHRTDVYIANDTDPNFLFRNQGDGTFVEMGLLAGVALGEQGKPQSGMGVACADYDGDGLFDLAVTNLDSPEYLAVYRNLGNLLFEDVSTRVDVYAGSSRFVGFGTGFFDFDNDADLDLFAVNGHIDDLVGRSASAKSFKQPKLLFTNIGGRFREATADHGQALLTKNLSRGAAFGDYDNDGDIDILVGNAGERPMLLRNDGESPMGWLTVRLLGEKSNKNGIGALVKVESENGTQASQVLGGGSYLSASDLRVHFGLGKERRVKRLTVHWPSGIVDQMGPLDSDQFLLIREGKGLVAASGGRIGARRDQAPR